MNKIYEKGKIKVVWVEDDYNTIYSKMFDKDTEAKKFAETKTDYLVFALVNQHNMEEFKWKLLPYGRYKSYQFFIKLGKQNDIGLTPSSV